MIEKIGSVKCSKCGRVWTAACESVETKAVECPDCGFMQPINDTPESAPMENAETNATPTNKPIMPFGATGLFHDMYCPHCNGKLLYHMQISKHPHKTA